MFESLIPSLGIAVAGVVAWAARRYVKHLFAVKSARDARVRELEQTVADGDGRSLVVRQQAELWGEQKVFLSDLHAAVKRLSDSNEKKDKAIDRLMRDVATEREKVFNVTLELRTKQREVEELEAERRRLQARPPPPDPLPATGDE